MLATLRSWPQLCGVHRSRWRYHRGGLKDWLAAAQGGGHVSRLLFTCLAWDTLCRCPESLVHTVCYYLRSGWSYPISCRRAMCAAQLLGNQRSWLH